MNSNGSLNKIRSLGDASDETLSIQVYSTIRNRIFRGEWLPGTRLTLRALAADLGTSVQPVREAIGKLTVERVLALRPNYSVQIPGIDRPLMDQIFAMRNLLEAEAARRCVAAMSRDDIDRLEEAIHATRRVYTFEAAVATRVELIQTVGYLIAIGCGSSVIADQIINLRTRAAPYYAAALSVDRHEGNKDEEFIVFTIRIQNEFISALRRRDGVAASEIRKVDLYTFQHFIYKLLGVPDNGADADAARPG